MRIWDYGRGWTLSIIPILCSAWFLSACTTPDRKAVDKLNEQSYSFHYRNIDSTEVYARKALTFLDSCAHQALIYSDYDAGRAEALNNLAHVYITKMEYKQAYSLLDSIGEITDSQVELLVADVQRMRLCQRESHNKDFYDYHESALRRIRRISEDLHLLTSHEKARMDYACSEFHIVTSTYYYYVGLEDKSAEAIEQIRVDDIEQDTAQYLAYLYNVGAGGIVSKGTQAEILQTEFDHLMRCYLTARQQDYPYWEANSMQAISEHLSTPAAREQLIADNLPAMKFLNIDQMPDSLLAGNLAQRSLEMFTSFGDVYQTAGSYRTLASCYFQIGDYTSSIICLEKALHENQAIAQAPDLVASIREQLSMAYSAVDNKRSSDENRNIYLDLQEQTRQDRYLESRADQLNRSSMQLNYMMLAVVIAIVTLMALLLLFYYLRRHGSKQNLTPLLEPLKEWQERNEQYMQELAEQYEEANEQLAISELHLANNKKRNLEQRAKVSVINSITPFIDRMIHEINRLEQNQEDENTRQERYTYISELTKQINDYNDVLTEWIQMRQGELSLQIESFPLQSLFDIVKRGRMSFQLKGVTLEVTDTDTIVKADRILTLFMLNTLADNARKFTSDGGKVTIQATATDNYVEVSIIDSGVGMSESQLEHLFDHKPLLNTTESGNAQQKPLSHGFGLMNCKGIIEKYRKISQIFHVCTIGAKSEEGKGSSFFFRLPKGITRLIIVAMLMLPGALFAQNKKYIPHQHAEDTIHSAELLQAAVYADSAYYCNINGTYTKTLAYADSCRQYLNAYYRKMYPKGNAMMTINDNHSQTPAEIVWYHDSLSMDYGVILDMRNEVAVAALALHQWSLYRYNNKVYTQLFKEISADNSLGEYVRVMKISETNKTIAVILLVILLLSFIPAYYFIYYRHRLRERFCLDSVGRINRILLDSQTASEKLALIEPLASDRFPEELRNIVQQITDALRLSVERSESSQTNIELVQDNCRRANLENERLHISNSILDNCLSTLKHETMYYPSRIQQLIDGTDQHLDYMSQLAIYYKELYYILSSQAMRQVDTIKQKTEIVELYGQYVYGDKEMLHYLFSILKRQSPSSEIQVSCSEKNVQYVEYDVQIPGMNLSDSECRMLFTPDMKHIPYLLCRQIVRDIGESTNHRGCGITAEKTDQGVSFIITLAKALRKENRNIINK